MEWTKLLSTVRLGREDEKVVYRQERSEFQTDFDRIVFSNAFRRLQNKTQVVPLPKTDFVHTRLTHSLEASCVGRSLGRIVAIELLNFSENFRQDISDLKITPDDISALVATACLAHDIGNPPFGHSGEDAISDFFRKQKAKKFIEGLTDKQIADLQNFEGNSVGFRLLSHSFPAVSSIVGGMGLTYATLGTIVKYPKESLPDFSNTGNISEKKFGFFQSEAKTFKIIAEHIGLKSKSIPDSLAWFRHPLSFLVEAADDICYKIVDLEDAYKMHLIDFDTIKNLLCEIIASGKNGDTKKIDSLNDETEKIGYLRAKAIGVLVESVADKFIEKYNDIMKCKFDKPLLDEIPAKDSLKHLMKISVEKI